MHTLHLKIDAFGEQPLKERTDWVKVGAEQRAAMEPFSVEAASSPSASSPVQKACSTKAFRALLFSVQKNDRVEQGRSVVTLQRSRQSFREVNALSRHSHMGQ